MAELEEADGDGAMEEADGAADEDAEELEPLEPPQAVSPRRAAAVRPTKARAGRFVDNMSFSLFLEPGRWVRCVWDTGGPASLSLGRFVCVSPAIRRVGRGGWVGIQKTFPGLAPPTLSHIPPPFIQRSLTSRFPWRARPPGEDCRMAPELDIPPRFYGTLIETTVRVLTWNVWGLYDGWEEREAAIVRTLTEARPDILVLAESWEKGTESQCQRLAGSLGLPHRAFTGVPAQEDQGALPPLTACNHRTTTPCRRTSATDAVAGSGLTAPASDRMGGCLSKSAPPRCSMT